MNDVQPRWGGRGRPTGALFGTGEPAPTGLGPLIRSLRESRGVNYRALGKRVGVDPTAIWRIEHGQRGTSLPTLARIADVLALTPAERVRLIEAAGFAIGEVAP